MRNKAGKQLIKRLVTAPNLEGQRPTVLTGEFFKPLRPLLMHITERKQREEEGGITIGESSETGQPTP